MSIDLLMDVFAVIISVVAGYIIRMIHEKLKEKEVEDDL